MYLIDRYIVRLFTKTVLVCFASMMGLFIVIDVFGNLEEFLNYIDRLGPAVLIDYYGPRVLMFFDRISPLLALLGAIFTLTWMQHRNETTALMSLGIPQRRVVMPLLWTAAVIALLAAVNRELGLPSFRDQLTRNAQNWLGQDERPLTPTFDLQTRILLTGKSVVLDERKIVQPVLQLPTELASVGEAIVARSAIRVESNDKHPAGYWLRDVTRPVDAGRIKQVSLGDRPVIVGPRAARWLKQNELFVASGVTFEELAYGRRYRRYLSTWQLIQGLRNPSLDFGADARVMLHSRILQPMLDVSLLLLGLPLVTRRKASNMFIAAGLAILLVLTYLGVLMGCQALGSYSLITPPALAAWLPLVVFGPPAYVAFRRGWD